MAEEHPRKPLNTFDTLLAIAGFLLLVVAVIGSATGAHWHIYSPSAGLHPENFTNITLNISEAIQ